MGGAVTIGGLIIDSGDRSVGNLESVGCSEALNDSPRPEVQVALLDDRRCSKLSRHEVVIPGIVGGLLVSSLH